MPLLDREQRLQIARIGLAAEIAFFSLVADNPQPKITNLVQRPDATEQMVPDLGLTIDEEEFWKIMRRGYAYGFLPETDRKDLMYCPPWAPGICMAEASPNFTLAVNGFMAEFMFRQTEAVNPIIPIKMIFIEDWWRIKEDYVSSSTAILRDDSEIHIIASLKMEAFRTFKIMEREGTLISPDASNHFRGTLSLLISRDIAHELIHAGKETKKLGLYREESLTEATHPQVYDFEEKYDQLMRESVMTGFAPETSLLFGAELRNGLNILSYRDQIIKEAQERGIK
ncbi:hypothetical protein HYS94_04950 [Candidatus Daviesbacteria bacterium]|nr:hypothetical protein [Candidatus Daviesbacteria bacterium]